MGIQTCGLNLNHKKKEMRPHGTSLFPCAGYCGHYSEEAKQTIPWHWHKELEIVYVRAGALIWQVPGQSWRLEPGDCLAVNSNVLHCAAPAPECELHSLVFDPSLVFGSGESVFAGTYIRPLISETSFDGVLLGQGEQAKETELFRTAFEALADEKFGYEFTVRECLSKICLVLCRRFQHEVAKEQTGADQDQVRIREMLDYIHCHYRDEISLEDIAGAADIGTRECLRCFRRMIRISPIQYLLRYRIMQGAELLVREPLWSVSEIAARCGFDSPSYFSQMFRRFYSCTPRDYRRADEK